MKELDFDFFMSQDAGRTFYRGLFIYASLYSLKHYSLSPTIQRALNFVQTELWKPSNCFIAMRPRLRLLYVAAVASFVPYLTKRGAQKALGSEEVNLFYGGNVGLGMVNGGMITGLCLTFNPWYVAGGSLIGAVQGAMWTFAFRYQLVQRYNALNQQSKYEDKDFTL
ncbi:hypothetical protein FGO68_gene212 [Halteria grandinella]|uniref:Uncharacterized protein n=1 Tax=Halteria grandinella TaxID=5974 RepID=A0A8J8T2Q9_HALGN|nr:hypothetical protein FGO68_gene212 [Halteria grandinella]